MFIYIIYENNFDYKCLQRRIFIKPFLKHHVHLFDEGIIIDYKSTDKTIEIARKIAPHWKVVSPNIPRFHGSGDVHNIHHVERSVNGWKMSLNITEFLFTDDLKKTLKNFEKEHPEMIGIRTNGINIVDKIEDVNTYDDTIPLLLQKHMVILKLILLKYHL